MLTISKNGLITITEGDTTPVPFILNDIIEDGEKVVFTVREIKDISRCKVEYGEIVKQIEVTETDNEVNDCECCGYCTIMLEGLGEIPKGYYAYEMALITPTDEYAITPTSYLSVKEKLR